MAQDMATSKIENDASITPVSLEEAHGEHADVVDHRENDDRTDEAKGFTAEKVDKSYWYSWRFLGSMFAAGTAFMGGIGSEFLRPQSLNNPVLNLFPRHRIDLARSW